MKDIIKQIVVIPVDQYNSDIYGLSQSGNVYKFDRFDSDKKWKLESDSPKVMSVDEHKSELRATEGSIVDIKRTIEHYFENPRKKWARDQLKALITVESD